MEYDVEMTEKNKVEAADIEKWRVETSLFMYEIIKVCRKHAHTTKSCHNFCSPRKNVKKQQQYIESFASVC